MAQQIMTNHSLYNFFFHPYDCKAYCTFISCLNCLACKSFLCGAMSHPDCQLFLGLSGSAILLVIVSQMVWFKKKIIQHTMHFNFLHNVFLNLFPSRDELRMILQTYTGLQVKYLPYQLHLTETHQKVVAKNAITVVRNIFKLKSDN